MQRIGYSLCAAMLGAMCISGDITASAKASGRRWTRDCTFIAACPRSSVGAPPTATAPAVYYDAPVGWQAVVRRGENGETLVVFHRFGGEAAAEIVVPVPSSSIVAVYDTCGSAITAADGQLRWHPPANFSAASVLLRLKGKCMMKKTVLYTMLLWLFWYLLCLSG